MKSRFFFSCLLVFLSASFSQAQTTFATITGTISDATGAVAPNITVTATHEATNTQTSTQSNESGVFTLAQLKEGAYTVRARGAGFKEYVAQNITLVARDYRRLDISLVVGAVETTIEVSGGATLIETESARISDTKSAELLKSIPLNTRGIWAFLSLSPSVLQAAAPRRSASLAAAPINRTGRSTARP
jgi:hypothetical protein